MSVQGYASVLGWQAPGGLAALGTRGRGPALAGRAWSPWSLPPQHGGQNFSIKLGLQHKAGTSA